MSKPIILVDGSSYLFRAFHAIPMLTNHEGTPTNAMLGVLNMLKRLRNENESDHIAVVFDPKGKNFRHELYPDYKANRVAMPDELRVQIEPLFELIKLLGYPLIIENGYEADDVIGTLTHKIRAMGKEVLISTGDKDMAQLIQPEVTLIDTMKNAIMDSAYVQKKFGVRPDQVIDFLALVGDTSDNIPGIPKVGPKTAAKWLAQYDTLENLKSHAGEIKGKVGENLRAHLDQLDLAKQLTTIVCDLDIDLTLDDLACRHPDVSTLTEKFNHWGFKTWLKELDQLTAEPIDTPITAPSTPKEYECILTQEQWALWRTRLEQAERICFDTETTSLNALQADLVGVSFAIEPGKAAYLPLQHAYPDCPDQLPFETTLAELKTILENPAIQKIGQNLKYDLKVLARHGVQLQGIYFDTMLASYICESGLNRHDMDTLAQKHLNVTTTKYEEVAGKGAKQICFSQVPLAQATDYAAEDADITLQLYQHFNHTLEQSPALKTLFFEEEMPMLSILAQMELLGVRIDAGLLHQQSQSIAKQLHTLEQQAYEAAGATFNLASPKQLITILFDKMQLPSVKKTPKGQPSTSEEALQELAQSYTLPRLILEHRHLSKLKSTYTDKLPQQIDPDTGRIHTSYHQAVASTGRLSSSDPNLQNIPIRTEQGRQIRRAFTAPKGHVLIAADYSQIELRIMAHLSQDASLLDAFAHNQDIHRATASEVFGSPLEDVTAEQRRRAKAINFGLIYGMSAFGLAKQLGIGRNEAQAYVDTYFERYPGVADYMERTRKQATEQGYVETLFGRRLYLPEINSNNPMRRKGAERAAINAPMQGTAADIIKRAMIAIDQWLHHQKPPVKMIMQVHDELIFEVPAEQAEHYSEEIKQLMSNSSPLDVPLLVEAGIGPNWEAAH